jgi:hypothetical protein
VFEKLKRKKIPHYAVKHRYYDELGMYDYEKQAEDVEAAKRADVTNKVGERGKKSKQIIEFFVKPQNESVAIEEQQ